MERRELFKILAAGAVADHAYGEKLHHFTAEQNDVLDRLSDIIIPSDELSRGAHEAKVSYYLDLLVHHSPAAMQDRWKRGIDAVQAEAQRRFARKFQACSPAEQEQIVARMAAGEDHPTTGLERFFPLLKRAVVDGYRWSEVGVKEYLKANMDVHLTEFPGCTHTEHKRYT